MDEHDLDIPDFLRRLPGDTPEPPLPKPKRKRTWIKHKRHPFHLPKTIEPAGLVLLKQMEHEKEAKKQARLATLRQLKRRKR